MSTCNEHLEEERVELGQLGMQEGQVVQVLTEHLQVHLEQGLGEGAARTHG